MTRRAYVAVALVLIGVGTQIPSALAAPFGPKESKAFADAVAYWGRTPPQCSVIETELVPPGSLANPNADGQATLPPSNGEVIACKIWVVEGLTPLRLCHTMRHEYGHLLGYNHDDPELALLPACSRQVAVSEVEAYRRMVRRQRERCLRLKRTDAPLSQLQTCWENLGYRREQRDAAEAELASTPVESAQGYAASLAK